MEQLVFERFRSLIHQQSGIALTKEKLSLLSNRIAKRIKSLQLPDAGSYLEIIESDLNGAELVQLIDAVSTNVTYFYREKAHFEFLASILSKRAQSRANHFNIWCAACSSGEEAYTLAMLADKYLAGHNCKIKILATDISTKVLTTALEAVYDVKQLRDLPEELRTRYLSFQDQQSSQSVKVNSKICDMVTFRQANLSRLPLPLKGRIDIIFCRNVMIYFDQNLRQRLVDEFTRLLDKDGYLFVGHSESLVGCKNKLSTIQPGIYQRADRQ